jgi:ribosomal protein S7
MKKKNCTFYSCFVGYLTKKGNKRKAKKIVDSSLLIVSREFNLPLRVVLTQVLKNVGCSIELKTIHIRKNISIVPISINQNRKYYLTVKKIVDSLKQDIQKKSLTEKLIAELTGILLLNSSNNSLKKTQIELTNAVSNKSNIHFRW